jgi:hypothetical protein
MKKVMNRGLMVGMIVWLLTITCNLPNAVPQVSAEPTLSAEDLAATAVSIALTAQAGSNTAQPTPPPAPQPTQSSAPPTPEPSPTQCYALVTANTNANVRNGPGTAYDAVGYLPIGGTARVAGQNDARTWWYIEFAGGPGGYAWIAGSVTTSACIPAVLQVVAAPPLPTAVPQIYLLLWYCPTCMSVNIHGRLCRRIWAFPSMSVLGCTTRAMDPPVLSRCSGG